MGSERHALFRPILKGRQAIRGRAGFACLRGLSVCKDRASCAATLRVRIRAFDAMFRLRNSCGRAFISQAEDRSGEWRSLDTLRVADNHRCVAVTQDAGRVAPMPTRASATGCAPPTVKLRAAHNDRSFVTQARAARKAVRSKLTEAYYGDKV